MSSVISLGDQFLCVSNQRLWTLLDFAQQVGRELARRDEESRYVEHLRRFEEEAWPGIDFDLGEHLPGIAEKKFWARVFHEVGHRIFLRQIGNHDVLSWQSSAIGDAYVIARMLTRAVQEDELGWYPGKQGDGEADGDNIGRINVRL